ncbi:3-hydroxyacyl-CoA dehydrogenase NAD-binding domain-containing protein [Hoeflea alexandrii]|uniref:3-hydroxyacyl-CoA dehydrogenase NAD-binding domain-containing protein n=1 Tax=Hoeflea alexandrii TaxID=288436 RepID=UPI0022AF1932|nr:3-hydroxyacyl-CoA dehydrogenase NAD-binding domain-containing protein [Hoeflea alexandrii]
MLIETSLDGAVQIIKFSDPPVNALSVSSGLVEGLRNAVSDAIAAPEVDAIVIHGGARFSGGTDIKDFEESPERLDAIRGLQDMIEAASKPVIAAINGLCLGGGLELAVSAHYRVASSDAQIGFPEVTLGLLPGGGGTQRTVRLVGAARALELMLGGRPISAQQAAEIGLIDRVVEGDAVTAALEMMKSGILSVVRPTGELPVPDDIASTIVQVRQGRLLSVAEENIVACVEAVGRLGFREGQKFEARLFGELMQSETAKALRHVFLGRSLVSRIPCISKSEPLPIGTVTVIGGGLMGTGIATALLTANLRVNVVEPDAGRRDKAQAAISKTIHRDVQKGKITQEVADERLAALSMVARVQDAAAADLFIEAVFEDIGVKRQVFEILDQYAPAHALLASNTSTLDLDAIAAFTKRPQQVVGMHFFSPANIMRLLEIVRGAKTSNETLISAMAFAKKIRKTGVVAGVCDGFIGNRIFEEYLRQAWFLLEEGALPQQVDLALEAFGMAMGPCRVMDLAGQDIGWNIRKRRAVEQPARPYSRVPDLICELGRFGQKTGAGFYKYPDGRTPEIDPEIENLIEAESGRIGLQRRIIDDKEIVDRCILAMINEGARIVGEGIAYRPVDVDIVYVDGYGFPTQRGGPMFFADQRGLENVLKQIRAFAAGRHGWAYEPAPLLETLVAENRSFSEMNKS